MAITLSGTDGITSPSFVPSSTTAPIVGQYLPSANTIGFVTAGTEKLRIDSSGNVGLGVTPSGWGSSGKAIQIGNTALYSLNTGTYLKTNTYYDGAISKYISSGYATSFDSTNGGFLWATAVSGTSGNTVNFTNSMTLDVSGNLSNVGTFTSNGGVATFNTSSTSAGAISFVNINGPSGVNTGGAFINFLSNNTDYVKSRGQIASCGSSYNNPYQGFQPNHFVIYSAYADMAFNADTGNYFKWYLGNTQAMTLNASGNLGIGTTTPDSALHIVGSNINNSANTKGIRAGMYASGYAAIEMVSDSGLSGWIDFHDTSGSDFSERIRGGVGELQFYSNGALRTKIDSSGNFITTGNAYVGGHNTAAPIQKTYRMDMGTYYSAPTYLNYAVRIGRFTGTSTGKLHARIVRHGDYNYPSQYSIFEISVNQWGSQLGVVDFCGKEMLGTGYTGRWTTDSNKYLYFLDDMLWEQNGYLMIYADENFEFTMDNFTQASLSGLTWRNLTTTIQSWEHNFGA